VAKSRAGNRQVANMPLTKNEDLARRRAVRRAIRKLLWAFYQRLKGEVVPPRIREIVGQLTRSDQRAVVDAPAGVAPVSSTPRRAAN
jgi:hypothetical protein